MNSPPSHALRASAAKVGLSTASVFPESTAAAFEVAGKLGYDGVEVMVWTDPISQDAHALRRLSEHYSVPRWQRDYARRFRAGIDAMAQETGITFAIENMFPLRMRGREISAYQPGWDVVTGGEGYADYTLDLSHTAVSQSDALGMLDAMGDRLAHLHIGDGTGVGRDEHLVPGRGTQPCAEVLERVAARGFDGHVIVEVSTRRAIDRPEREADLAEALAYCRLHLVAPPAPVPAP